MRGSSTGAAAGLALLGAAAAWFCFDRLCDASYARPRPLGEAADLYNYFYPSVVYLKSALARGELPLWNPHQLAGAPFLAAHQPAALYPLLLAWLWLPAHLALAAHAVAHVFLAGAFTLLYARRIGLETSAAVSAGLAYMFAYTVTVAVFNTAYLATFAWLPAILLGVHDAVTTRPARGVVLLGSSIALAVLSGYSQGLLYSLQFAAVYAAVLVWRERERAPALLRLALAAVLGVGAAAAQLAPTAELAADGVRSLSGLSREHAGGGVPAQALLDGVLGRGALALPALAMPLAAVAMVERRTRLHAVFFLFAAIVVADFMRGMGGVVFPAYFRLPLGNLFRFPSRAAFVYAFCAAMLVGLGQAALLGRLRSLVAARPLRAAIPAAALAAVLTAVVGVDAYRRGEVPIRYLPLTNPEMLRPTRALIAPAEARGQYDRLYIERDIPSPVAFKLGQMTGAYTLPDYEPALPAVYRDYFGFPADARWHGWMSVAHETSEYFHTHQIPLRKLDLLSVRFYADARFDPDLRREPLERSVPGKPVHAVTLPVPLVERADALPHVYVVHETVAASSREDALRAIGEPGFDPRRAAVVETTIAPLEPAPAGAFEYARILEYRPQRVDVEARCDSRCLVVLTDLHYPGWSATVDGAPAEIVRTNYLVRGVAVGPGVHRIVHAYRPKSFIVGAAVSAASVAVLTGLALASWLRKRRSSQRARSGNSTPGAST